MNKRKKIAVFANGYGMDTLYALLKGIKSVDICDNFDFFVFISYASYDDFDDFNAGELKIYDLPVIKDYDGAIVLTNALNSVETGISQVRKIIEDGIPVVSIGIDVEGACNINIDNISGMKELAEHLIGVHKVKRPVIIGGYRTHPESITRIDTIKTVFSSHGIEIPDEDIYYGDWGNVKTEEITRQLVKDPKGLPDAIIAANDIMALTCATELTRLGYSIPEDTIVTGYDYISRGQLFYPVLTTVDSDYERLGVESINFLNDAIEGKDPDLRIVHHSKTVIGESCGCSKDGYFDHKRREYGKKTYLEYMDRFYLEASERTLTQIITGSEDYKELTEKVVEYYKESHALVGNDFHIVIHSKYFDDVMADEKTVFDDASGRHMRSLVSVKNGKVETGVAVKRNDLIPGYSPDPSNHIYFLMPLHTGEYNYGYIVASEGSKLMLEYLDLHSYIEKFMLALRIQRSNLQLKIYNENLKKVAAIDAMTGLYNRLELEDKAAVLFDKAKKNGMRLLVMFIDINRMKQINDIYGHINGDAAIRLTANAISSEIEDGWVPVRFGGDEFLVIGSVRGKDDADKFRASVLSKIDFYNNEGKWPFTLSVSSGYILSSSSDDKTISDYIREADKLMYETKKKMHSGE